MMNLVDSLALIAGYGWIGMPFSVWKNKDMPSDINQYVIWYHGSNLHYTKRIIITERGIELLKRYKVKPIKLAKRISSK